MSNQPENSIARRQFLRGAAGLVGATVVGSSSAVAQVIGGGVTGAKPITISPSYSVGYWDGLTFTDATSLAQGDPTLQSVHLTLKGFGDASGLISVDAMFPVSASIRAPFQAWKAGPSGCKEVMFTMPVDASGITFNLQLPNAEMGTTSALTLRPGSDRGAKLRAGIYVIVPGAPNWSTLSYTPSLPNTPLTTGDGFPANVPQYLVVSVDPI